VKCSSMRTLSLPTHPPTHPSPSPTARQSTDGLGDSGDGWASVGEEFTEALPYVKFIFPHAPAVRMPAPICRMKRWCYTPLATLATTASCDRRMRELRDKTKSSRSWRQHHLPTLTNPPSAPPPQPYPAQRPITINMGTRMPGWYDISSLEDIDQREDAEGMMESKRWVLWVGGWGVMVGI